MAVLARKELEQSPLADLHALASELGIEGYRLLRREDLIGAIVASQGGAAGDEGGPGGDESEPSERAVAAVEAAPAAAEGAAPATPEGAAPAEEQREERERPRRSRRRRGGAEAEDRSEERDEPAAAEEVRTGILDILPNGSGFVRADAFAHSPEDVYLSPAQIRRCELRTGDEVTGPVRPPRRSERYPSLVRVEKVNGEAAEPPAERPLFAALTASFARERLSAPDELADVPFGKGSRVAIAGPPGGGATTLLRRVVSVLRERHPDLSLTVVLAGARPEEVREWRAETDVPVVGGSFDGSAERQGETATMAVERAKRIAERGGDAVVVVDSLDLLPPAAARRVFGAARNTEEAGSVTVVGATGIGPDPARHATTRVVLRPPAEAGAIQVDGETSGTLRSELLS